MDLVLIQLEHLITKTSDVIWPVFVPFMLILGAYMAFTTIFKIQPKLTKPSKLKYRWYLQETPAPGRLHLPDVDQKSELQT